ncbi:sulfotransferase domain-containing protein [Fictibacillus enclensis]|uniref:sulfotransferase domain-containing protein n=1 Tax=Fictibacillus enclensis TaxID=1017270 RepID=UPI00333BD3BC
MTNKSLPPFLMTSVPKSGTHMLHQILNGIPGISMDIQNGKKKFFFDTITQEPEFFLELYRDHHFRLTKLKANEFGLGHVFYTKEYANILQSLKMKHIFLYRDPRDVLVSLAYFIGKNWSEHPLHTLFNSPEMTVKLKLMTLLYGTPSWPDFQTYMSRFYCWLEDEDTLHVCFEDLIRNEEDRKETLSRIVNYLYGDLVPLVSKEEMLVYMIGNINPQSSATFRSGKIGSWHNEFDGMIKQIFKEKAGDLLIRSGYEHDHNW